MISTTAYWEEQQYNLANKSKMVVVLDDGVSQFCFSTFTGDFAIDSAAVVIYDKLLSVSGLKKTIDPFTKKWNVATLTITLSNEPHQVADSSPFGLTQRPSDELAAIRFEAVQIYLINNERATDLVTHGIKIFEGIVDEQPQYSLSRITLKCKEIAYTYNVKLPLNMMYDTFADTPEPFYFNKIPISYGQYTIDLDDHSGLGLAVCYPHEAGLTPDYVASDHGCHDIEDHPWTSSMGLEHPARTISGSAGTPDDSGYATARTTDTLVTWHNMRAVAASGYTDPADPENAYDDNEDTHATITDSIDNGSDCTGHGRWYLQDWPSVGLFGTSITVGVKGASLRPAAVSFSATLVDQEEVQNVAGPSNIILLGGETWADCSTMHAAINGSSYIPSAVNLSIVKIGDTAADSVADNLNMMEVNEIRIITTIFATSVPEWPTECFIALEGREYNSWITGRSSGYSDGDMIEDPAGIIESLLRDEAGKVDANIDEPSFIEAENTSVKQRVNLHERHEKMMHSLIREIAEQSTFVFLWTLTGVARLVDLSGNPGSVDREIPYAHIVGGDIQVSDSKFLINKLNYRSRYRQEYAAYADSDIENNAASQAVYDTWEYDAEWRYLATTSAAEVADHLVGNAGAIWTIPHDVIEFATIGHIHADLEPGDWIGMESASVDAHLLQRGASWSGNKFLIIGMQILANLIKFKAIKLY